MSETESTSRRRRITIGALAAPNVTGGLASYARLLAAGLHRHGTFEGSFFCAGETNAYTPAVEEAVWPTRRISRLRLWRSFWKPTLRKLASRLRFHSCLQRMSALAISRRDVQESFHGAGVIHFIGTGWDILGFALLHVARRIGAQFTVLPAVHPQSWGDDKIDLLLYRQADAVFCLSDCEAEYLLRLGLRAERVARTGLPPTCRTDGDRTKLRARLAIGQRPAVLFIGRRDAGKGYPALLAAWAEVLKAVPDAVLLLCGPCGAEWEPAKLALPAESYRDLGVPDEAAKASAYAACDVLCLPSAHESFGIVYVEAWSYGKAVICGTAPASRELVRDRETGLWCDGTAAGTAAALIQLLQNPALRDDFGAAGLRLQKEQFTAEKTIAAHLQAWERNGLARVVTPANAR